MTDYTPTGNPEDNMRGIAKQVRDEFLLLKAAVNSKSNSGSFVMTGIESQGATANDYVLTVIPDLTSYTSYSLVAFIANHTNTSACTLRIGALPVKLLKDVDGNALEGGDIESGSLVTAYYNGVDFYLASGNDRAARSGDTYAGTHNFMGATLNVTTQGLGDFTNKAASTAFVNGGLLLKANIDSPTLTGTPKAPTAPAATVGSQIATLDYVNSTMLGASLPGQSGNSGALMSTDGTNANWTKTINGGVVKLQSGGDIVGTTEAQTLMNKDMAIRDSGFQIYDNVDPTKTAQFECSGISAGQTRVITVPDTSLTLVGDTTAQTITNKTINQKDSLFTLQDDADITKQARFECSPIATGTTRIITIPNEDITLGESPRKFLLMASASNSAQVDLENVFTSAYYKYIIEGDGVRVATTTSLLLNFKLNGVYATTNYYSAPYSGSSTAFPVIMSGVNNAATYTANFTIVLSNPHISKQQSVYMSGSSYGPTINTVNYIIGNSVAGIITGLRFFASSDNLVAGNFRVYGLK